jgi:hypothetical protein
VNRHIKGQGCSRGTEGQFSARNVMVMQRLSQENACHVVRAFAMQAAHHHQNGGGCPRGCFCVTRVQQRHSLTRSYSTATTAKTTQVYACALLKTVFKFLLYNTLFCVFTCIFECACRLPDTDFGQFAGHSHSHSRTSGLKLTPVLHKFRVTGRNASSGEFVDC